MAEAHATEAVSAPCAMPALLQATLAPQFLQSSEASALFSHHGVPSCEDISMQALRENFVAHNKPVVLPQLLSVWQPVLSWDTDYLRGACAGRSIYVREADESGCSHFNGEYTEKKVLFSEYLATVCRAIDERLPCRQYGAQIQATAAPRRYHAPFVRRDLPELFADTRPEPEAVEALGARWSGAPAIYIGAGNHTPLHFDVFENLLCIVRGRKRVRLWHPAHSHLLSSGQGCFSDSAVAGDLAGRQRVECPIDELAVQVDMTDGDALYLPCGWWHDVASPAGKLSVSLSYWARPSPAKQGGLTKEEDLY
eukprot:6185066-Pleurochrysis_carterae.AAC.2